MSSPEKDEKELRLKIVQEIAKIVLYAGVRADGNVAGIRYSRSNQIPFKRNKTG